MVGLILTNYSIKLPLARSNREIQTRSGACTTDGGAILPIPWHHDTYKSNFFFSQDLVASFITHRKKLNLGACPLRSYQKLLLLAMMIREVLTGGELLNIAHPLTLFEEKVASSRWRGANKHSSLYPSGRSPSVRWPDPPGSSSGTDWSEEESVKWTRLPCNWVFSLI